MIVCETSGGAFFGDARLLWKKRSEDDEMANTHTLDTEKDRPNKNGPTKGSSGNPCAIVNVARAAHKNTHIVTIIFHSMLLLVRRCFIAWQYGLMSWRGCRGCLIHPPLCPCDELGWHTNMTASALRLTAEWAAHDLVKRTRAKSQFHMPFDKTTFYMTCNMWGACRALWIIVIASAQIGTRTARRNSCNSYDVNVSNGKTVMVIA